VVLPRRRTRSASGVELHADEPWNVRLQTDGNLADRRRENGGQVRISWLF
jgi:hypothetical protein